MVFRFSPGSVARGLSLPIAAASLTLAVTSCGGGGGGSSPGAGILPQPTPTPTSAATAPGQKQPQTATVKFVIAWPNLSTASASARHRNYISPSTKSIQIVVTNGATVIVDNPTLTTPGAAGTTTTVTTTEVGAPIGNTTFTVGDYSGTGATGSLLAANSIVFDVLIDRANTVSLTLNGNLSKILCAPVSPFVTGTTPTFTQVGATGQVILEPLDAGSNIIIGPGTIPQLSLAATTPAQGTITQSSTQNEFNTNILVTGVAVALTASGTDLNNDAITNTTCNITRVPALYVTNRGSNAANPGGIGTQSVTIYPATATGNVAPIATVVGSATTLSAVQFPAVDPQGNLYVTNQGPAPGATFGPTVGYVSIYGPGQGQNGNQAPIATMPNMNLPSGITFDPSANLYVTSFGKVQEWAPGVSAALGTPKATIAGSNAAFLNDPCYGMFVTAADIYLACENTIDYFPYGSNGNATATSIVTTPVADAVSQSFSWLSVAADSSGDIFAPGSNQTIDAVDEYASGETTAPITTVPTFSQPVGIFIDSNGYFYVVNFGNNSVDVFDSQALLEAGTPTATISGALTGLSSPYGVYVR